MNIDVTLIPDYKWSERRRRHITTCVTAAKESSEWAAAVSSNSQLYKQAGNSVTVPVVQEIASRIAEEADTKC